MFYLILLLQVLLVVMI